jgi:hypothetical protein
MSSSSKLVQLAEHAAEVIAVTELEPVNGEFAGKRILSDGTILEYPKQAKWFRQRVELIPATVSHLFAYLRAARQRNVLLIRGAPADLERASTLRQLAQKVRKGKDRGNHGFLDEPTRLFWIDIDGVSISWRGNIETAIRRVLAQLGEPWASTAFVWYLSASHGLELKDIEQPQPDKPKQKKEKKPKRWTGNIVDGKLRVRLGFITDRALGRDEAVALTHICKVLVPKIDPSIAETVQPNYIRRPQWMVHPDRDPLGNIATIGRCVGTYDYLVVPEDLPHKARWAKAQGVSAKIADDPDATTAVRAIGSDASVRSHLMAAVIHLVRENQPDWVTSYQDHSLNIVAKLQELVEEHRNEIIANLKRHNRSWNDVLHYLPDNMLDWAVWVLEHPAALQRKTVKLGKEEKPKVEPEPISREAIYEQVKRAFARMRQASYVQNPFEAFANEDIPPVELIAAPTGSRKSTEMRGSGVADVTENPGNSVVILVPRHELGREQIDALLREHPDNGNYVAAVWHGRFQWDPEIGDGKEVKMCQREAEAKELQDAMLDIDSMLCKQGRGKEAVRCPLFDVCGWQRQKQMQANIWFAAHEMIVHQMPKAFGEVMRVYIDESPIDACMFGIDHNDLHELALDKLLDPAPEELHELDEPRRELHRLLDKLKPAPHRAAPLPMNMLRGNLQDQRNRSSHLRQGLRHPEVAGVESKTNNKEELERKADGARRMYAALLVQTLAYDGDIGVVTYKSTETWLKENCFVPDWIKFAHFGDVTGTNKFQNVRAFTEAGRNQPPPEALALQAEALFGEYIAEREYREEKAIIPMVPDAEGHTRVQVTLHNFRHPIMRKLLWQAREAASIQSFGRARAGLRDASSPLVNFRWTDLPIPELGPVEAMLWDEVDESLDAQMLAAGGVWLACIPDAAKAYPALFTVDGLKTARKNPRSGCFPNKESLLEKHPHLVLFEYHTAGAGKRRVRGLSLRTPEGTRVWLEKVFGVLKAFHVLIPPEMAQHEARARRAKGQQKGE